MPGWTRRVSGWLEGRAWFEVTRAVFRDFAEDKALRLAAALAYFTIFSIAPLLLIVISVAGFFFGEAAARAQVMDTLSTLVGEQGSQAIGAMLAGVRQSGAGLWATLFGVVALLLGATGVFAQLQDALNTIWEVRKRPGRGIRGVVRDRILSFGMVLAVGFLLLVSLVVTAALAALGNRLEAWIPLSARFWLGVNLLLGLVVTTILFAVLFKLLPDVRIAWPDVWLGASVTAVLFLLGQVGIGLYLGRSDMASVYGAAGSLVIVLVWVFYSAVIFFLGAEFVQVYANRYGQGVEPDKGAVPITLEEQAQQGIHRRRRRSGAG